MPDITFRLSLTDAFGLTYEQSTGPMGPYMEAHVLGFNLRRSGPLGRRVQVTAPGLGSPWGPHILPTPTCVGDYTISIDVRGGDATICPTAGVGQATRPEAEDVVLLSLRGERLRRAGVGQGG